MAFSRSRLSQVLEGEQFEYLLDLEVHKAARYLYFFSLLAVQFDGHDAEGELGNDQSVASTMSRLIRGVIRETDVVGRIDRAKFFVMLHQADRQQARLIGERIMQRTKNYAFMVNDQEIRKTITIGGACFPTNANDMSSLVMTAEDMLSKSMEKGNKGIHLPD
jgi:diguanylate cyclase (GGDEF)-like protein